MTGCTEGKPGSSRDEIVELLLGSDQDGKVSGMRTLDLQLMFRWSGDKEASLVSHRGRFNQQRRVVVAAACEKVSAMDSIHSVKIQNAYMVFEDVTGATTGLGEFQISLFGKLNHLLE